MNDKTVITMVHYDTEIRLTIPSDSTVDELLETFEGILRFFIWPVDGTLQIVNDE